MATSNRIRALNRAPFDFDDGLKVGGVDITNLKDLGNPGGSALVNYESGRSVQSVLDTNVTLTDYTALRAYSGRATMIRITGDGTAGLFKYDAADTASVDNGGTVIVAGTKRWKRVFDGAVNAGWFGAKGDGVTNDTPSLQLAANAIKDFEQLYIPTNTLLLGTVFFSSKNYITVFGSGSTIKTTGNVNPLKFENCVHPEVFGFNFVGTLNSQQYEVAFTGAQVEGVFDPATWVLQDLVSGATATSNVVATKAASIVSVALTGDEGLNISRGVQSSALTLNPAHMYVPIIASGFNTGIMSAAPRFTTDLGVYEPQNISIPDYVYEPIKNASTLRIRVGTGRAANMATLSAISGYVGAQYDVSKISILRLINDATNRFTLNNAFVEFAGGSDCKIYNCNFSNHRKAVNVYNSPQIKIENNTGQFLLFGFDVTNCPEYTVSKNTLNHEFLDNLGNYHPQLFWRAKSLSGDLQGSKNVSIVNNNFVGASWGVELVSKDVAGVNDVTVKDLVFKNNVVSAARCGVSFNALFNAKIEANTIITTDAFAMFLIETANSASTIVAYNTGDMQNVCGFSSVAMGITGNNMEFLCNIMKAPICIAAVSTSGVRTGAVIKGNIFKHANTPILLRNVVCDVADNNMSPYLQGYYHGIGNAPELNAGIVLQFPNTSTASSLKIRSNSMVGGLMGVAIIDAPRFDFTKNDIYIRYKRDAALGIISQLFSGTTDTVRVNVTDNQFDNAAGYDPTISGFVNMSTPVNGTIVTQNNISTPVDFMSFNFVSTSGAGAITQRGGIRGGGSFVWNPGTIANGTTHVTTVTGLQNTTGLYYEVTPPYNMQGCQVFAYSYYDGAFILKLAISNTTGASVTFGSGTFNLRGIRISP